MSNIVLQLVATGIKDGVSIAEADKAQILGSLDVSEAGMEKTVDVIVDGFQIKGVPGFLEDPVKNGIKNAIHQFLATAADKQSALFDLGAAAANAYAEKLAAS